MVERGDGGQAIEDGRIEVVTDWEREGGRETVGGRETEEASNSPLTNIPLLDEETRISSPQD